MDKSQHINYLANFSISSDFSTQKILRKKKKVDLYWTFDILLSAQYLFIKACYPQGVSSHLRSHHRLLGLLEASKVRVLHKKHDLGLKSQKYKFKSVIILKSFSRHDLNKLNLNSLDYTHCKYIYESFKGFMLYSIIMRGFEHTQKSDGSISNYQ